jgi:hypothetical protein
MMNFKRGQDPKQTMGIGIKNPKYVDSIAISVRNRNIEDPRSHHERRFSPNPQTVFKDRIRGKSVGEILHLLETNMKFPWDYFFNKYPEMEDLIINKKFSMSFSIVLKRDGSGGAGYPALHLSAALGEFLIYDNNVYHLKKNRP